MIDSIKTFYNIKSKRPSMNHPPCYSTIDRIHRCIYFFDDIDNYRNVNVYRDSQPYSGRKIVIMRIMLSFGGGVAFTLSLSLTVAVAVGIDIVGLTLRGVRLLGRFFGHKIC